VAPRRLFALDQNFPEPIVRSLDAFLECAELVPVRLIEERMPRLEDWELLKAIHDHERDWDGLITSDDSMLNDARAMAVLKRTGLTLVIAHGQPYTSNELPPDCPSRRAFATACKAIPGAARRGKCWVVPREAWETHRGRPRRTAGDIDALITAAGYRPTKERLVRAGGP